MLATPKNSSEIKAYSRQMEKVTMIYRRLSPEEWLNHLVAMTWSPMPPTKLTPKNMATLNSTTGTLPPSPAREVVMVSTTMPSTSSMMAAPRMVLPTLVDNLPSSRRVSTEMLTDVAVRMTPMNAFCQKFSAPRSKSQAAPKPMTSGAITPMAATSREARPERFSPSMSVPRPALNMMMMTPSSAIWSIKLVSGTRSKQAGPSSIPAMRAPTTWGRAMRRVNRPSTFVLSRMTANCQRNE